MPVAIETFRGLLVACLRATGRPVYAITPMAAARYRDRDTVTRKKAGHLDAMVLANILRTDKAAHCPLPDDSELALAIAILARAPGRRLGPHSSRQQTPLPPARILPRLPRRLPAQPRGDQQQRRPYRAGRGPHPRTGGQAHPHPAALTAEEGRPPARHRDGSRTASRRTAHPSYAPIPAGRAGHGPSPA
ncbi:IS110 family transposase [Streptomyces sp. NRRL F-5630]|uniref:IS110 family transposase n=1 Tax=Streptomyces sp. NRRL F-5630 TaxID=1463864 RepID=UPI003B63ABEC